MAFLSCIAYYVACTWGAEKGGYGTHQWNISILQAARMDLLIVCMPSLLHGLCS